MEYTIPIFLCSIKIGRRIIHRNLGKGSYKGRILLIPWTARGSGTSDTWAWLIKYPGPEFSSKHHNFSSKFLRKVGYFSIIVKRHHN